MPVIKAPVANEKLIKFYDKNGQRGLSNRSAAGTNEIFRFLAALALLYILRWVISQADVWVAQCLIPLALWVLLNGLDDLVLDITCACS